MARLGTETIPRPIVIIWGILSFIQLNPWCSVESTSIFATSCYARSVVKCLSSIHHVPITLGIKGRGGSSGKRQKRSRGHSQWITLLANRYTIPSHFIYPRTEWFISDVNCCVVWYKSLDFPVYHTSSSTDLHGRAVLRIKVPGSM